MTQMPILLPDVPAPGAPRAFRFPAIEHGGEAGAQLRAVHLPGRPLARLMVVADGGTWTEPDSAWGAAALLSRAFQRGAAGLGVHDLAVAFERLGASPSFGAGTDDAEAYITVPPALVGDAAALLAEVVRRPTLAESDILEVRATLVDEHVTAMTEPATKADRALLSAVWDPMCRLSVGSSGTEATVAAIEPEVLRGFHASRWRQVPLTVIVVGDLTVIDAPAVARRFAGAGDATRTQPQVAASGAARRILVVDVAGAAQSQVAFGRPGPAHGHADAEALDVALSAATGSFSSRLNTRLREELGYTYGVRATMTRWRDTGLFSSSFSVRTDVTADALRETLAVLDGAIDGGLDDDEIVQARANLVERIPVGLDSPDAITTAVARLVVLDLPDDHHEQRLARLRDVDTSAANAALRQHVATNDLQLVVVGDADAIVDDLRNLDLAPVDVIEA